MTEIWKPIPGCPGYEASSEGRVRSLDRYVPYRRPGFQMFIRGKVLKLSQATKYLTVVIARETRSVHELVLLAFEGPRPFPEAQGRHLDGSKLDNRPTNLTWGTPQENQMDRFTHGTACAGEDNYRAIQTEEQVLKIMELRGRGLGPKSIAEALNCERSHVKHVIYGQSWNWLTGLPRLRHSKPHLSDLTT